MRQCPANRLDALLDRQVHIAVLEEDPHLHRQDAVCDGVMRLQGLVTLEAEEFGLAVVHPAVRRRHDYAAVGPIGNGRAELVERGRAVEPLVVRDDVRLPFHSRLIQPFALQHLDRAEVAEHVCRRDLRERRDVADATFDLGRVLVDVIVSVRLLSMAVRALNGLVQVRGAHVRAPARNVMVLRDVAALAGEACAAIGLRRHVDVECTGRVAVRWLDVPALVVRSAARADVARQAVRLRGLLDVCDTLQEWDRHSLRRWNQLERAAVVDHLALVRLRMAHQAVDVLELRLRLVLAWPYAHARMARCTPSIRGLPVQVCEDAQPVYIGVAAEVVDRAEFPAGSQSRCIRRRAVPLVVLAAVHVLRLLKVTLEARLAALVGSEAPCM